MLALAPEHVTFWWLTLGLGIVVISAVILLLQLLVTFVKDIDQSVALAWEEAGGVATHTATTWMLKDTVDLAGALRDETRRHADALDGGAGAAPQSGRDGARAAPQSGRDGARAAPQSGRDGARR